MYELEKTIQTSCFTSFTSLACQQNLSWEVQFLRPATQIPKELTNVMLIIT